MLNFDNFKYNTTSLPSDADERKKFYEQLEQEFYEEVKNSEVAGKYFENYRPDSIESFIKAYASKKLHLTQCYQYYSEEYHELELKELNYQKQAEEMLELILQKKLFNIQLRWRAGELEIEGIEMSHDFCFWEQHIMDCPFIPTITSQEVELLKEYLLSLEYDQEADEHQFEWQNYEQITEKNEEGDMDFFPNWYHFYDNRMGTGMLLLLPDKKGKQENFYLDIAFEPARSANRPVDDSKPFLHGWRDGIFDFAKYFEQDKYFAALFKYCKYVDDKFDKDPNIDDLREAIEFLATADRPIYFKSHLPWDKALLTAAKEYQNTKIVEALDFAFDQYLMMKELGFAKDKSPDEIAKAYSKDYLVQFYREKILEGRVKNGEPKDFNY